MDDRYIILNSNGDPLHKVFTFAEVEAFFRRTAANVTAWPNGVGRHIRGFRVAKLGPDMFVDQLEDCLFGLHPATNPITGEDNVAKAKEL